MHATLLPLLHTHAYGKRICIYGVAHAGLSVIGPHFSSLSALHTLDMSTPGSWPLKGAAVLGSALATLPVLRDLSLAGVCLEDSGWAAVAAGLRRHPLTSLDLARCSLKAKFRLFGGPGDCGTTLAADVHARTTTGGHACTPCDYGTAGVTPRECGGRVESPGVAAAMGDTLQALDLSGNDLQDNIAWETVCWRQVQSLSALQTLRIGRQGSKHDKQGLLGAAGPGASFRLRALAANSLRHGALTYTLSGALRLHTGLTALDLHDTAVRPGAAAALGALASLRELRLGKCKQLWTADGDWQAVVHALGGLTSLQLLALEGCGLDAVHVVAITQHLSGLTRLQVRC